MTRLYATAEIGFLSATGVAPLAVDIEDGRSAPDAFSWQTNGFELRRLPSAVTDWNDATQHTGIHADEVTAFATAETGCDAVLFYPPLLRSPKAAQESADYAPIPTAHSDYTEDYGPMLGDTGHPYHALISPSMIRAGVDPGRIRDCRRILTLQLWRNLGPALMADPLCVADARTVPRDKLVPLRVETYGGHEAQFDAFGVLPADDDAPYRWVTFPEMQPDEVLLFRAFDSDRVAAQRPFWTPHCAFPDPRGAGTPRSSIEMRAICLFW
ncbi:MAG: CmcJ/NvfI family oxidoreductase [Pseudomonadota bacterium]